MKAFLTILLIFSVSVRDMAVDLTQMDSLQRRAYLLEKSKEVVMIVGPDYYREYGELEITRQMETDEEWLLKQYPMLRNRHYYLVTRKCDGIEERLMWNYFYRVGIWEDTGEVIIIELGNGVGYMFLDFTFEYWLTKLTTQKLIPIPYQQMKPGEQ